MRNAMYILLLLCVSCVSAKKYKALESDFQKEAELRRSFELQHKTLVSDTVQLNKQIKELEKGGKNE